MINGVRGRLDINKIQYIFLTGVSCASMLAFAGGAAAQSCVAPTSSSTSSSTTNAQVTTVTCSPLPGGSPSTTTQTIASNTANIVNLLNGARIDTFTNSPQGAAPADGLVVQNTVVPLTISNSYLVTTDTDTTARAFRLSNTTQLISTNVGLFATFSSRIANQNPAIADRVGGLILAAGNGINVSTSNPNSLTINNDGQINAGLAGILAAIKPSTTDSTLGNRTAQGGSGSPMLAITNNGSIVSRSGRAIDASVAGGSLSLTNNGEILGNTGISASVTGGSASDRVAIVNAVSGQIYSGGSKTGYAIDTSTSTIGTTVDNSGVIYGPIRLSASRDSVFTNNPLGNVFLTADPRAGEFRANLAVQGTSDFSRFINNGTVSLAAAIDVIGPASPSNPTVTIASGLAGNAPSSLTITQTGPASSFTPSGAPGTTLPITALLDRTNFTNNGVISLGTGSGANRLIINGDYVGGAGSTLSLQASTQANTSDRLIITGNASGRTAISVNNLTPTVAFSVSPVLVQVNGTLASNTFTLAGIRNFGTMDGVLINGTDSSGNKTISLGAVPNAVAASAPTAVVATRTIAEQGSSAVLDRVTQVRDGYQRAGGDSRSGLPSQAMQYTALVSKDPIAQNIVQPTAPVDNTVRVATWARATGDIERRTGSTSYSLGGSLFSRDLGYTQETGALLGGTDVVISGLTKKDDGLVLGLLGGYTLATVNLNANAGRQDYEGGTVGAYGTYIDGPAFIDALFKVDLLGLNIIAPGVRQNTSLQNYSFASNVGYRFPFENGTYIEPTAGIDYVDTQFNRRASLTSSTIALRDGDAFRGRIGTRIGSEFLVDDVRFEPTLTTYLYSVLYQSGPSTGFNGVTSVTGIRDEGKVRGEVQAALNFFNLKTGVSGFVRADFRVGGDLLGGGGRVGVRYAW